MRNKFEHLVSHTVSSFLDAKNLCTGVKRRDNECTCVISFREENFELLGPNFPQVRKLFSKFLGLQVTCTDGLRYWSALPEWTINFVRDTIVFTSSHKVLTFNSHLEYTPGWQRNCFAMNSDRLVAGWHVGLFPNVCWSNSQPQCGSAHTGTVERRDCAHVHPQGLRKYEVYVSYSYFVIKWPRAMGPERPNGCGVVTMSDHTCGLDSQRTLSALPTLDSCKFISDRASDNGFFCSSRSNFIRYSASEIFVRAACSPWEAWSACHRRKSWVSRCSKKKKPHSLSE